MLPRFTLFVLKSIKLKYSLIVLTFGGPVTLYLPVNSINVIHINHRCYKSLEGASQDSAQDSRGRRNSRSISQSSMQDSRDPEASQARPKPRRNHAGSVSRCSTQDSRNGRPRRLGPNPGRLASSAQTPNRPRKLGSPCGLRTPAAPLVIRRYELG